MVWEGVGFIWVTIERGGWLLWAR